MFPPNDSALQQNVGNEHGASSAEDVGSNLADAVGGDGRGGAGGGLAGRRGGVGGRGGLVGGRAGRLHQGGGRGGGRGGCLGVGRAGCGLGAGGLGRRLGGRGRAGAGALAAAVAAGSAASVHLDALVGAAGARVRVRRRAGHAVGLVRDLDGLVVGVVRGTAAAAEGGVATGPRDGTRGLGRRTAVPGAELDLHGRLGESGAILGSSVGQGAHDGAVNRPDHGLGRPVHSVGVEGGLGVGDRGETATVVGRGVALAEVVGLDLGGIAAEPLPVDLVEVVGLQDEAGDDAGAGGDLDHGLDGTEEQVLGGGDGGGVGLRGNGELGALGGVVVERGAISKREVLAGALPEVNGDLTAKGRVSRASCDSLLAQEKEREKGLIVTGRNSICEGKEG